MNLEANMSNDQSPMSERLVPRPDKTDATTPGPKPTDGNKPSTAEPPRPPKRDLDPDAGRGLN